MGSNSRGISCLENFSIPPILEGIGKGRGYNTEKREKRYYIIYKEFLLTICIYQGLTEKMRFFWAGI